MRRLTILAVAAVLAVGRTAVAVPESPVTVTVTVDGDSVCPAPGDIATRVAALLAGDASTPPPSWAHVDRSGAELRLRLVDERGVAIAERTLTATSSCAEMADIAAVAITSWLTQLRPERLPLPRLSLTREPREGSRTLPLAFDVGAGIGASAGEGGVVPAAALLLSLHARAGGPGVVARASGTTAREVSVGAHVGRWRRWDVTVGPSYQTLVGRWRLCASLGFSAGWFSAAGQDLPVNQSSSRFSSGFGGLLRLDRPVGAWAPWFAVAAASALRDQPLTVTGSSDRRAVRPTTVDMMAGIALGRFP